MQQLKQRNTETGFKNHVKMTTLKLTVENLTPPKELCISHFWFGLHDGNFDTLHLEDPTRQGIKRTAEDGNLMNLTQEFTTSGSGIFQGIIVGLFRPLGNTSAANTVSFTFSINTEIKRQIYFSYKAVIIGNDTFVANQDKLAHQIFDTEGNFIGADFIVFSSEVIGAGVDVNDELSANQVGVFFSERFSTYAGAAKNTFIHKHIGYHCMFAHGNITVPNYQITRIKIETVSVPPQDGVL